MLRVNDIGIKTFTLLLLTVTLLLLGGCSSSWKAPLSTAVDEPRAAGKTYRYLPGSRYYKVNPGDTLYGIAWETGNAFEDVVRWNNLKPPYTIYPGQGLHVTQPPRQVVRKKTTVSKKTTPAKTVSKKTPAAKKTTVSKAPSAEAGRYVSSLKWQWPTQGKVVQSFSYGDATKKGVMLSGASGQAIVAAEGGKVVYSGSGLIGYGRLIIIKHNNKYLSAYGYNNKIYVKEGDWVTKGEKIASMGLNGKGQPGLHFEIRKSGKPVNPVKLLPRS